MRASVNAVIHFQEANGKRTPKSVTLTNHEVAILRELLRHFAKSALGGLIASDSVQADTALSFWSMLLNPFPRL